MDNKPNLVIFHATDPKPNDENKSGYLTRIGAGWSHKDGKGASFSTIYGRIVVRNIEPKEGDGETEMKKVYDNAEEEAVAETVGA